MPGGCSHPLGQASQHYHHPEQRPHAREAAPQPGQSLGKALEIVVGALQSRKAAAGQTHGQFIRGVSRDSMALKFLCEPESLMGRRRRRGEERVLEGRSRERCGRGPCEGRGAPGSGSTRPVGAEGGGSLRWKEIRVSLGRSGGAGLPGARGTSWTWPRRPALPH